MRHRLVAFFLLLVSICPSVLHARQGFSIGLGPVGNVFLIDTIPILDPGVGGHMFFDYRFHEQVAFETTFFLSSQDGNNGGGQSDNGILLLGMPAFDVKFYLLSGEPRWDPFISTGIGVYFLTEGSFNNSTGGVGLGSQLGVGFDYYLADFVSLGFQGVFRSVALVTSLSARNGSEAVFPYSLMGNVAFHF